MLPAPPLLLITDRRQARGDVVDVATAACRGGCRWISLREKDLPAAAQLALFARLRIATSPFGARLILHGSAELAATAGADGVHLSDGSDPAAARQLLGRMALIGLSAHPPFRGVDPAAVDYITVSPIFFTASKPGYGPALGCGGLAMAVAAVPVPVVALGGIDASNAAACRRAGASGLAVMGGVMRADNPDAETAALIAAFQTRSDD